MKRVELMDTIEEIPGLGAVTKDSRFNLYYSQPMPVSVLGGRLCRIAVARYEEDPNRDDLHAAIANFLSINPSVLTAAERAVYRYYQDCNTSWEPGDIEFLAIESPREVWNYVQFGSDAIVQRRSHGDEGIYVSLECNCAWEDEHGLQIVFKNGLWVNKIGPYDGHLTNSDAFGDVSLEEVVYRPVGP